jgi:hypothetical protein
VPWLTLYRQIRKLFTKCYELYGPPLDELERLEAFLQHKPDTFYFEFRLFQRYWETNAGADGMVEGDYEGIDEEQEKGLERQDEVRLLMAHRIYRIN